MNLYAFTGLASNLDCPTVIMYALPLINLSSGIPYQSFFPLTHRSKDYGGSNVHELANFTCSSAFWHYCRKFLLPFLASAVYIETSGKTGLLQICNKPVPLPITRKSKSMLKVTTVIVQNICDMVK